MNTSTVISADKDVVPGDTLPQDEYPKEDVSDSDEEVRVGNDISWSEESQEEVESECDEDSEKSSDEEVGLLEEDKLLIKHILKEKRVKLNDAPLAQKIIEALLRKAPFNEIFRLNVEEKKPRADKDEIDEKFCAVREELYDYIETLLKYDLCFDRCNKLFVECDCMVKLRELKEEVSSEVFRQSRFDRQERMIVIKESIKSAGAILNLRQNSREETEKHDWKRVYTLIVDEKYYYLCKYAYQNLFGVTYRRWQHLVANIKTAGSGPVAHGNSNKSNKSKYADF